MNKGNMNYKIAFKSVMFLKIWHLVLILLGTVGLGFFIFFSLKFDQEEKLVNGVFTFLILIITSVLYFRVANYLLNYLKENRDPKKLKSISVHLVLLFILDACSALKVFYKGRSSQLHLDFLEILSGSEWQSIYIRLSQYFPPVYSFFKPQLNGSILIILALYFLYFSKMEHE